MSQYLSLADYLLLAVQLVLAVALVRTAARMRLTALTIWAIWASARLAAFWYLALTASAERYGDWFIHTEPIEGLLLAVCAVELGAAMLPGYRRQVWQRGPVCVASAVIVAGVIGWRTDYGLIAAETNIITGASLAVIGCCYVLASSAGGFYRTGRALCFLLAGQLLAVQIPAWLGCDTPACLTGHSAAAWLARRTGPILWAVAVAGIAWAAQGRPDREGRRQAGQG